MNLTTYKINSAAELLPIYEENPQRFMRFYNAVYLLLCSIPEGGLLRIADHCKPSSYGLFVQCACLCMMEEYNRSGITDALLEFSDDYVEIRRCMKFKRSTVWIHPNSRRRE